MQRITIKHLATQLGINVSTVSRALKDHPDISVEMRERVKKLAEELNYIPNIMAVHLRKRESKVIGLVIPTVSMFFFPSVIQGIEDVAHTNGYHLWVLPSNDTLHREIENIDICFQNGIDGLLLSVCSDTNGIEHLTKYRAMGLPIVLFDKVIDDPTIAQVIIDDSKAAQNAIEHLIDCNRKRIIGVFDKPNMTITKRRVEGFKAAFAKKGITMAPDALQYAHGSDEAFRIISTICSHNPPDAVFAMSDELLAGSLPALKRSGLNVPSDCSVVAISDGYLPNYLDPPISFIEHSGYEIGKRAAERLCALMKKSNIETEPISFINTILKVQASSM